jgi:hypothetical protein
LLLLLLVVKGGRWWRGGDGLRRVVVRWKDDFLIITWRFRRKAKTLERKEQ